MVISKLGGEILILIVRSAAQPQHVCNIWGLTVISGFAAVLCSAMILPGDNDNGIIRLCSV